MLEWLVQSAGISHELTSRLDQVQWHWARPMVLWGGLICVAILAFLIIRRHARNLPHIPRMMRWALNVCRVVVLVLLVGVLAGPYLRVKEELTIKPVLPVIIDDSLSMTLPAGPFDETTTKSLQQLTTPEASLDTLPRQMLLEQVLTHHQAKLLPALEERFDIRVYRVARNVRSGKLVPEQQIAGEQEQLDESNLGEAITTALDDAAGKTIGGLVLFTDGRWTTGQNPQTIATRLAGNVSDESSAITIWTVPVGSATASPDVAVVDVLSPGRVAHKDTAGIIATIDSQQMDGRTVNVQLLDKSDKVIDEKPLTLNASERQQVELSYEGTEVGSTELTVQAQPHELETIHVNNEMQTMIEVDANKLRVLYIDGAPRWDFRFLDHSMRRDKGIEAVVVTEAQYATDEVKPEDLSTAAGLPQDATSFAQYQVVLLGDISPDLLPPKLQEQLAKAVEEEGLGLVVQAGPQHMPHKFIDGPLGQLLPLQFGEGAGKGGVEAPSFAPFEVRTTAGGAIHPALQLYYMADRNRRVWSQMPAFYWTGPEGRAKPAATVLADYELRMGKRRLRNPLIASQFVGRGRCVYIGTDATYRWRRNIGSHLFYRFWGQTIRFAAGNEQQRDGDSWIQVYPKRVEPGEQVGIELFCVDADGNALDVPEATLSLSGDDFVDTLSLLNTGEPGRFKGTWTPDKQDQFVMSYTDGLGRRVTGAVHVIGSTRELRHPTVDRDSLALLGETTGGGMLELTELEDLPDLLTGEPTTRIQSHEDDAWDNWLILMLLVSVYCVDVGIRRLMGLT